MLEDVYKDTEAKMNKAMEATRSDFASTASPICSVISSVPRMNEKPGPILGECHPNVPGFRQVNK